MRCPRCGAVQPPGVRACPNCGRPTLQSITVRLFQLSDDSGRAFPLRSGITRIGRDPASNEVVLDEESVAARHAAIEVSPQSVVVRDLGSDSGTTVNGQLISRATVLQTGDVISFGGRSLTLAQRQSEPVPRGIPTPVIRQTREHPAASTHTSLPIVMATIGMALLALLLHLVGIADAYERETLPLPLFVLIGILAGLPVAGIIVLAAGKRSGYLVTAAAALAGLVFVAVTGPIFAGTTLRSEMTALYGSTGYWFVALAAVAALIICILLLSVSLAGWRMHQPQPQQAELSPTH